MIKVEGGWGVILLCAFCSAKEGLKGKISLGIPMVRSDHRLDRPNKFSCWGWLSCSYSIDRFELWPNFLYKRSKYNHKKGENDCFKFGLKKLAKTRKFQT